MAGNYVFDNEILPGAKVDGHTNIFPPNQVVTAAEFNEVTKALADIRTILDLLLDPTVQTALLSLIAVSATGRVYLKLNNPTLGNQVTYLFADDSGFVKGSLNPPP
jgi:hypothetical protein